MRKLRKDEIRCWACGESAIFRSTAKAYAWLVRAQRWSHDPHAVDSNGDRVRLIGDQ